MDAVPYLAAASAVAALILAFYYYKVVETASPGNERMVFLMGEIQKGARAFLRKEYQWVSVFVVAMMILLAAPFVFQHFRSGGMSKRLFIGVLLGLVFVILNRTFGFFGLLYGLPPVLGAGMPLLLFLLLAV